MDWMNMGWVSTYWMPLVIALVLGFILGWLLTGLSPRRKNSAYEAQIADLESSTRKRDRDLADARKESDRLKSSVSAGENSLADLRTKLSAAEAEAHKLSDERAAFEADVQARNIEVADLKMQLALLQDQAEKSKGAAAADMQSRAQEVSSLRDQWAEESKRLSAELDAKLNSERERMGAEVASAKQSAEQALQAVSAKDAALNETYGRIVNLQRVLEDREAALAAAQAELTTLRTDVNSLKGIKAELEDRLQKTRGDVAGEMAVLTSTMVKMKEDQLTMANVRIAELMNELNAAKTGQAVG